MTSPVITVAPETTVREIAALLLRHRISGVPVVEGGRLVGMVSESDLMHRGSGAREKPPQSWWLRLFTSDPAPGEYVRSHALHARDIMERNVVTVTRDTPVTQIAELLETHRIKRVPVLRGDAVVGIVSRSNLIQGLAVQRDPADSRQPRTDAAIRLRVLKELERQPWWRALSSSVVVTEGVVHYWGMVSSDDERAAARVAAENVAGVRAVEDHRYAFQELVPML